MNRNLLFGAMTLVLMLLIFEALAWIGLAVAERLHPRLFTVSVDRHFEGVSDAEVQDYMSRRYDAVIGWDRKPFEKTVSANCADQPFETAHDAAGARQDQNFDVVVAASYGDSFTEGAEVNDDETWQHYLAAELGEGVLNYGVSGHGTLQALMKMRAHVADGHVFPVTILGVHESNLSRAMSGFRPFLWPKTQGRFAFKPHIRCPEGTCTEHPNPLTPEVSDRAGMIRAGEAASATDYWASAKPVNAFPHLWNLFKLSFEVVSRARHDGEHTWYRPEGERAMLKLVSEFVSASESAGSRPVLLLLPSNVSEGVEPGYAHLLPEIERRHPGLLVIDVYRESFERERFNIVPYSCHASPYGNQIIARALQRGLADTTFASR